jgi:hypothetical protein
MNDRNKRINKLLLKVRNELSHLTLQLDQEIYPLSNLEMNKHHHMIGNGISAMKLAMCIFRDINLPVEQASKLPHSDRFIIPNKMTIPSDFYFDYPEQTITKANSKFKQEK